jgi:hypothetical protein
VVEIWPPDVQQHRKPTSNGGFFSVLCISNRITAGVIGVFLSAVFVYDGIYLCAEPAQRLVYGVVANLIYQVMICPIWITYSREYLAGQAADRFQLPSENLYRFRVYPLDFRVLGLRMIRVFYSSIVVYP